MFKTSIVQNFGWWQRHFFIFDFVLVSINQLKALICDTRQNSYLTFSKNVQLVFKVTELQKSCSNPRIRGQRQPLSPLWGEEGKTHQTQYQFCSTASTEKCCILPVPLYNNTSIIIPVAKMKRKKKMKNRKMLKINTAWDKKAGCGC